MRTKYMHSFIFTFARNSASSNSYTFTVEPWKYSFVLLLRITLLVRAGMSGNFMVKGAQDDYDKHAHLRFQDPTGEALCYIDYRRYSYYSMLAHTCHFLH
jgi:hypothetical protein